MSGVNTYSVTMVRPTYGLPSFEVGAYEYVGDRLPQVGETIAIRKVVDSAEGGAVRGFVTRVNTSAGTISVTEAVEPDDSSVDDFIVAA